MRAAVCRSFGAPLEIEELEIRGCGPTEVSVRIAACAICHSDIAFIGGAWGGTLPAVYGHEAAGIVETVGGDVVGLAPGDHVVVTLVRSCGRCDQCRRERPTLCEGLVLADEDSVLSTNTGDPVHQGMRTGAFAELVTVDASQTVVVSPAISLDVASLLACGVLTGIGAVTNTAEVGPGSTVVVLGAGGVGLNCVQGARLAGAERIVAVDLLGARLGLATTFGATDVVDAATQDAVEAVRELTKGIGADYVFVAAGVGRLVEDGVQMLRRGGTLVVVGLPPVGVSIAVDPLAVADGSLRILGSKMGGSRPQLDIPRLVDLYLDRQLKLDELVSERYELERINEAVASAGAGAQLRPVVVFP
jgi:Zn-dependent alcohol dehydrogenase